MNIKLKAALLTVRIIALTVFFTLALVALFAYVPMAYIGTALLVVFVCLAVYGMYSVTLQDLIEHEKLKEHLGKE